MSDEKRTGRRLQSVETSLRIFDLIEEMGGARTTELANQLDMAQSTVSSHLSTLNQNDYLVKEGDVYHLGLKFLEKGGYVSHRKEGYVLARDKVKELAEKTNERAQLIVEERGHGIYIWTETGSNAVQMDARIGKRKSLHASAAGKSILAHLPEPRREEILDQQGLPQKTPNTITDQDELASELESIREQGYSYNRGERESGLAAAGVPVIEPSGLVLGAFSVSGPMNRLRGEKLEQEIPQLLLGVANELELNLKY
ncbi:IclR family transcriptional regulator [Natrinema versiforme]|uniref:IclR family transcriptional regulator n=1 Tax=Natrinema versiforme TaxID=88724 RepID=A0A4P8WMG1_9EURY|nr:IclR family transcriptional regulator [Natrinema versiforme]QCS44700.1 IclR family transcriptional regulator [Natrinema versiforme]